MKRFSFLSRLDLVATLVLLPLTVVLCGSWGIPPSLDVGEYLITSAVITVVAVVPTFLLYTGFLLVRGEASKLWTEPLRLSGFFLNIAVLTVMSWIYSHLKAGVLLGDSHDSLLLNLDRMLCGGAEPWVLCKQLLPAWSGPFLYFIYLAFLPVIIGAIFWFTLSGRLQEADELTCAIALAYYLGVLSYHLVPAYGPTYEVASANPADVSAGSARLQQVLLENTQAIRGPSEARAVIPWKYIAAFPSLHMSHVLILMWYLRRSRSGLAFGAVFTVLTMLSTVYLGWHYVVDLLGGAVLAAVVLLLVSGLRRAAPKPLAA